MSRKRRRNPPEPSDYTLPGMVVAVSVALSAYHGVKRNNGSFGYGFLWGLGGAVFPIVTPVIAFAQGYARPVPVNTMPTRTEITAQGAADYEQELITAGVDPVEAHRRAQHPRTAIV